MVPIRVTAPKESQIAVLLASSKFTCDALPFGRLIQIHGGAYLTKSSSKMLGCGRRTANRSRLRALLVLTGRPPREIAKVTSRSICEAITRVLPIYEAVVNVLLFRIKPNHVASLAWGGTLLTLSMTPSARSA